MSARVVLTEHAQRDLQEIWWYVFQFEQSDERADAVVDRIYESLTNLAEHPALGTTRAWAPGRLVFPCGNYNIVYRVDGHRVRVIRVCGADQKQRLPHE